VLRDRATESFPRELGDVNWTEPPGERAHRDSAASYFFFAQLMTEVPLLQGDNCPDSGPKNTIGARLH
jgi:hypothetical protein